MSSSKVKCTCGWSWNKSDSSKKDMYICHECGRDNSNNIPKAQIGIVSKDVSAPLIPYSNEYTDSLEKDYLKLYNDPNTRMDDGFDAFYHSMVDSLPDVTTKAKGWVVYKPGTDIEEFTEDDGNTTAPIPGKNRMVKRVEDYEISDRPDTTQQRKLASYMQERVSKKLYNRSVSNKGYDTDVPKQKNGGWLDNYNDSEVSLPEGYVGEGYDTSGRDYSPAWGGQFEDGGELIPMAQNGRATRADSLALYNNALNKIKFYKNNSDYRKDFSKTNFKSDKVRKNLIKNYKKIGSDNRVPKWLINEMIENPKEANKPLTSTEKLALKKQLNTVKFGPVGGTNLISFGDILDGEIDTYYNPLAPPIYLHPNISPQGSEQYYSDRFGDTTDIPYYDPIAVAPFDVIKNNPKLVAERIKKYGTSGIPKSYLSKNSIEKETDKPVEVKPQLQPRVEAVNIQPIEQTPINIPVQELDFNTPIKAPKSYNVNMQRYNMKGPSDYYQANEEGVDYQRAMEIKAASDAYNRDIEKRYGPQNEYRSPKSAADAAERLKQLRQNVEVVPQYQMGGQAPKRRGVRYNEDGSVSTHLMRTETDGKGNWFSFPTLFQNSIPYADDSENWLDMSDRPWEEAYEEAKKRGEVINFGSDKDAAIKFGQGSWKDKKQMGGSIPQAQDDGNVNNEDYNMKRALELGYTADKNGHWPSVDYETGEWLKSKKHHTRGMELMAYELNPELRNKYNLIENEKGKLQYVPKLQKIEEYQIGGSISVAQKGKKVFNKKESGSTAVGKNRIPVSSKDVIKKLPGTNVHTNSKGEIVIKDEKGVYKPIENKQQPEIVQGGKPKSGTQIVIENKQKQAEAKKKILKPLDVTTDVMQLGNFAPNPYAQAIGKIGNVAGGLIDAYQTYDALSEEDYVSAAINAASLALPFALGTNTFRRNSKYLQPGQPLYPFSPQANLPTNASLSMKMNVPKVDYIEPFTKVQGMTDKSLLANRALLGTLGAETVYDTELIPQYQMGGSIPGSVGFTYARTNSPAPSNGPYAKKTKASAKDGEVIKDDRGQWDHPGEITEIGSNQITMQGVPYPVLGVSDEGDVQMMYPEEEYKFKGKKVTEFPMAKNGIRQEQKGLVNLDQLTNFTNYNTKQPGGWMDKYQ